MDQKTHWRQPWAEVMKSYKQSLRELFKEQKDHLALASPSILREPLWIAN